MISGSVIVSVVLSLPTTGPMLLGALKTQDVNLAATFLLFVAMLTVIGMLVSDLAAGGARSAHPLRRQLREVRPDMTDHDRPTRRRPPRPSAAPSTTSIREPWDPYVSER